ncbi:hypothetical protein TrST_g5803 [Triparma strigata]|uniref:UBC core domain-containing protein n=1 Tax=Triparma strigata TaxID=1606541 RepID=A0A9W7BW27_9STRA|nr:hypothetical protein TrST_g5803 [Triparma strigata]
MSSIPPALLSRLRADLKPFLTSPPPGCHLSQDPDNILKLNGSITGPEGTPFEGGAFMISIELSNRYPFTPPKLRFLTKIYHPNISPSGLTCLSTLKSRPSGTWSPAISLYSLMTTVRVLISEPEWDDILENDVYEDYKRGGWEGKAKEWTRRYAGEGGEEKGKRGREEEEEEHKGKRGKVEEVGKGSNMTTTATTTTTTTTKTSI